MFDSEALWLRLRMTRRANDEEFGISLFEVCVCMYRLDDRGLVGKIILKWMLNRFGRRRSISCGSG